MSDKPLLQDMLFYTGFNAGIDAAIKEINEIREVKIQRLAGFPKGGTMLVDDVVQKLISLKVSLDE